MSVLSAPLKEAIRKLEAIEEDTNDYLNEHMDDLYDTYVIPEMKSVALAMNLPPGFADGIEFIKSGKNHGRIINTWGTRRVPLALWFNYGTKAHWIAPVNAKILSWISAGAAAGRNSGAIFFQNFLNKPGNRMYSKGHYVSGLPRTEAMEIGLRHGIKSLKEALPSKTRGELKN